jgi:hypothetical protein
MPTGEGGTCAMAGTYHEAELIFEPGPGSVARVAVGGVRLPTTVVPARWYAVYEGPILE